MNRGVEWSVVSVLLWGVVGGVEVNPFDDSVLFKLEWPHAGAGSGQSADILDRLYERSALDRGDAMLVMNEDKEQYVCALPQLNRQSQDNDVEYAGSSPRQLLQRSCTYRIEMYWTYELCHGRYLLQYHEEKDASRRTKRQEFYLGQYIAETVTEEEVKFDHLNPPKRKIEDQMLPYYPVRYTQGTVCDITNKPRATEVHYVCVPEAKNQIYSFDEISSCEYEIVVLTPRLCSHPAFQLQENPVHKVECYPVEGAPPKPSSLTVWERERQWETRQYHKRIISEHQQQQQQYQQQQATQAPTATPAPVTPKPPTDEALVNSFLSGDYCLYGGAGWWKHEYCHGRQVIQFHEDPNTGRTEINLGNWNEEEHLKWITERPHKRPLKVEETVRQVSHYYTGGDFCDLGQKDRTVEVRLRCRETQGNSNAVTLYLLEPKPCEYILGVESQMFCDILQTADDDGLLGKV